jgi:hypothetical protein
MRLTPVAVKRDVLRVASLAFQDSADGGDLRVGDADRLTGLFPDGDDLGVLIGGENVEGLHPVAEVRIVSRVR